MNPIKERQNSPEMIRLLRARRAIYGNVQRVQRTYFGVIFLLPTLALTAALFLPSAKGLVAFVAFFVGLSDATLLDWWKKKRIKVAARIQEQFDCEVLDIPWNQFTAGKKVEPEEISEFNSKNFSDRVAQQLRDWYPDNIQDLDLPKARLVCQRTNLWYDCQLRSRYRKVIVFVAVVYFLGSLVFFSDYSIAKFTLSILVPFGPYLTWTAREFHRQRDTSNVVERLLTEINSSLEGFSKLDRPEARARELQDAIFSHRSGSPLVSPLIYRFGRAERERQMRDGAQAFIEKVRRSEESAL